jgi:GGDEF domain-containing protein
MRVSKAAPWAEGFGAGALICLLGLLRPEDPSFSGLGFLPQALASVLAASLLGTGPGALALAGAALGTAFLPGLAALLGLPAPAAAPRAIAEAARIPAAATLGCVLAAGWLRDSSARSAARLLARVRDIVRRNVQLKKMNAALSSLSEELERRVSGQRDSVSALYARIRKMDSQDMDRVLSGLLDAVAAFSQASQASIYEYDPKAGNLALAASLGPVAETALPLDGCVEGWVFRNDAPFSLRNVDDYLGLANVDFRRSVLCFPLKSGDLPWGVLNVREMPFYRYNPITERNLGIVVELSSSYIRKAADFRERVLRRPRNETTGLPGYGELMRILGEELARRAARRLSVSLVIVEILGFEKLAYEHSGMKAFGLLKSFAAAAAASAGRSALAFHFRADGQLAFLLPDMDRDGASLFCLGISGIAGDRKWPIEGRQHRLEIAFGLSAFPGAPADPEALVAEAEAVLARSKGAYVEHGGA